MASKVRLGLYLLIFSLLSACSAKQDLQTMSPVPQGPHTAQLSETERNVLMKTGQVDKNVPGHALEDVAREYKNYLRQGRATVCAFSQQSERYLAYARKVFRERGMPEELANLAIVESGYRPDAKSGAGAVGAWQFMPATGLHYGLAQDWWQDERLDPWRATEAAADYLQKLFNDFGDWPTAVAAYNAGEGKMTRALQGTGGRDFFEVRQRNHLLDDKTQLREETKNYVPRFLAVTKIMRDLPALGFDPINPERARKVVRFTAEPGTDLRALSSACGMSWDEFARFNPHHKRSITCTDKKTYVYVPDSAAAGAEKYLCTAATFAGWQPVKVPAGQTLEKISQSAHVNVAQIKSANPDVSKLVAGQTLILPPGVKLAAPAKNGRATASRGNGSGQTPGATRKQASVAQNGKSASRIHKLQSGETLYAVAQKYKVSLDQLAAANNIADPSRIRVGQELQIPQSAKAAVSARNYVVQPKDSLWQIAKMHNVSVEDLMAWNGTDGSNLRPGTTLVVLK